MTEDTFAANSRYSATEQATYEKPGQEPIRYLRRRWIPQQESPTILAEHEVVEGDRPDSLAATYLGDPEQYWRLCDSTRVMHPRELTGQIGRRVLVTLPTGPNDG